MAELPHRSFISLVAAAALALAACDTQPPETTQSGVAPDRAASEARIRAAIHAWADAFNAEDLDTVIQGHTEDVISSFAGEEDMVGREQLEQLYQAMFERQDGELDFEAEIEEVLVSCDQAYARVIWILRLTPHGGEPRVLRRERSVELWRLGDDGRWRLARWLGYAIDEAVPAVAAPED